MGQKASPIDLFPLPVLSIGANDGAQVKAALRQHGKAALTVELATSVGSGRAANVVAELPGWLSLLRESDHRRQDEWS